jgi:hypothetical protein
MFLFYINLAGMAIWRGEKSGRKAPLKGAFARVL